MNTSAIWYCCCLMTESLKMKIWSSSHVGTVLYRLRGQSMSYRFYCAVTAPRWSDCPTVQHQSGAFINYTSWLGSSITSALVFTSIYCRSRTAVHSLANESSRCGCFSKKIQVQMEHDMWQLCQRQTVSPSRGPDLPCRGCSERERKRLIMLKH